MAPLKDNIKYVAVSHLAEDFARSAHAIYWLNSAGQAQFASHLVGNMEREFRALADALGFDVTEKQYHREIEAACVAAAEVM